MKHLATRISAICAVVVIAAALTACTANPYDADQNPSIRVSTSTSSSVATPTVDLSAVSASSAAVVAQQAAADQAAADQVAAVQAAADQAAAEKAAADQAAADQAAADQAAADQAAADQAAADQAAADQAAADQAAADQAAADQAAADQAAADQAAAEDEQDAEPDPEENVSSNTRGYTCTADGDCSWPDGSFVAGADRCGTICGEMPTSGEVQSEWYEQQLAEQDALQSRIIEAEECLFVVNGECSGGPEGN